MNAFRIKGIGNLAQQLHRGPIRLVLRHLQNIDFALSIVEPGKQYPIEFIWHAITGVRAFDRSRLGDDPILLRGPDVRKDLIVLAEQLSSAAKLPLSACTEATYSTGALAQRFGVSHRTISRWRKRGLLAWKVVGENGRKLTVFPERAVRRFVVKNIGLVRRAAGFSQLNEQEHRTILERARKLAQASNGSLHAVALAIAAETGRGRETIRLILKRHDETHPHDAIFAYRRRGEEQTDQRLQIWEAYQDGVGLAQLATRFETTIGEVYETVTRLRAHTIKSTPIEYIPSNEYSAPQAESEIMDDPAARAPHAPLPRKQRIPPALPPYLRELFHLPLLTAAGEAALFRKMNYLKHRADLLRQKLVPEQASASELDAIEDLLEQAGEVKNTIVRANLRLVVRFAKRHLSARQDMFELVSEGNVALLRSVDLFDFTRGFKFSTYASWAVIRQLAGACSKHQRQEARFQTGQDELCEVLTAEGESDNSATAAQELLDQMSTALTSRQWFVLRSHYGLDDQGKQKTLEQIGKRLGLSKERVRQIESQAMGRLRNSFANEVQQLFN